jgi:hypothetical protein
VAAFVFKSEVFKFFGKNKPTTSGEGGPLLERVTDLMIHDVTNRDFTPPSQLFA